MISGDPLLHFRQDLPVTQAEAAEFGDEFGDDSFAHCASQLRERGGIFGHEASGGAL